MYCFSTRWVQEMNWLGEFSNATFRAEVALELVDTRNSRISYAGLEDLAGTEAGLRTHVGYINSYLGAFPLQQRAELCPNHGTPTKTGLSGSILFEKAIVGRNLGRLTLGNPNTHGCLSATIELHYKEQEDMRDLCRLMPALHTQCV